MADTEPKASDSPAKPPAAPTGTAAEPTAPSAPIPADTGVSRADRAPGPESLPGEPLTADQKGKATVRTRYPVDAFESGLDGVPTITSAGVEVAAGKVEALLEAAASARTELEVVG